MIGLTNIVTRLRTDRKGVAIIEYALLAALIGVALVSVLTRLEGSIAGTFTSIGSSL